MGFSKKHHLDGESEGKKWVIAGIAIRAPLRSISTVKSKGESVEEDDDSCSTTPTAKEARIPPPEKLRCPPAPRKRRPASTCHSNGVREFFTPPDLESVFINLVERAN